MKKIVYFLGAGFCQPLGMPVISNFMFKSREQFSNSFDKFSYFKRVYEYIDSLSKAKNFINLDLNNIEEIFSLAETHRLLGRKEKLLEQFIKEVINFYTPNFECNLDSQNINEHNIVSLFGKEPVNLYIKFISDLLGLQYKLKDNTQYVRDNIYCPYEFVGEFVDKPEAEYKIITMNYDLVVEKAVDFIKKNYNPNVKLNISKLHGSLDREIIAPSWNKKIDGEIQHDWKLAAEWLRDANEIRFLGFSLPRTDVYIKHLLSAALIESDTLQRIDVVTMDFDRQTESRYKELIAFPRYRFKSKDIYSYLNRFKESAFVGHPHARVGPYPEHSHESFFVPPEY